MATKNYVVRAGFNYRTKDAKGNEKVFSEGDTLYLDTEIGDAAHQLEYADEADRVAALKAEQKAAKAAQAASVEAQGGIDHEALAATVATAVAQALAAAGIVAPVPQAQG